MNTEITKKELRKFGIALGIILTIIGTTQLLKGTIRTYPWFYAGSVLAFASGIFIPSVLKPIYFVFTKIAYAVGGLITGLILIVVFYAVLTPIGLIARLFGKDFLDVDWKKKTDTYWIKKEQLAEGIERYEKQF